MNSHVLSSTFFEMIYSIIPFYSTFRYYLCDYAYYNSLFHDMDRSACVRVPEGDIVSAEDLTDGLAFCISEMLQQLDNKGLLKVQQVGVTTVVED